MGWTHDFINGFYYENWKGEKISPTSYYLRQLRQEKIQKGRQYILIGICEGKIKDLKYLYNFHVCDFYHTWNYSADQENPPENVVILSENEYIKNEKKSSYYRKYKGDHYLSVEVEVNKKLNADRVDEVCGFFVCVVKGKGKLYTREEFIKKFLS